MAARWQFWGCISALLTAVIWIYAVGTKSYEGFGFDWGTWRKKNVRNFTENITDDFSCLRYFILKPSDLKRRIRLIVFVRSHF